MQIKHIQPWLERVSSFRLVTYNKLCISPLQAEFKVSTLRIYSINTTYQRVFDAVVTHFLRHFRKFKTT